jgi:hypothetical protein
LSTITFGKATQVNPVRTTHRQDDCGKGSGTDDTGYALTDANRNTAAPSTPAPTRPFAQNNDPTSISPDGLSLTNAASSTSVGDDIQHAVALRKWWIAELIELFVPLKVGEVGSYDRLLQSTATVTNHAQVLLAFSPALERVRGRYSITLQQERANRPDGNCDRHYKLVSRFLQLLNWETHRDTQAMSEVSKLYSHALNGNKQMTTASQHCVRQLLALEASGVSSTSLFSQYWPECLRFVNESHRDVLVYCMMTTYGPIVHNTTHAATICDNVDLQCHETLESINDPDFGTQVTSGQDQMVDLATTLGDCSIDSMAVVDSVDTPGTSRLSPILNFNMVANTDLDAYFNDEEDIDAILEAAADSMQHTGDGGESPTSVVSVDDSAPRQSTTAPYTATIAPMTTTHEFKGEHLPMADTSNMLFMWDSCASDCAIKSVFDCSHVRRTKSGGVRYQAAIGSSVDVALLGDLMISFAVSKVTDEYYEIKISEAGPDEHEYPILHDVYIHRDKRVLEMIEAAGGETPEVIAKATEYLLSKDPHSADAFEGLDYEDKYRDPNRYYTHQLTNCMIDGNLNHRLAPSRQLRKSLPPGTIEYSLTQPGGTLVEFIRVPKLPTYNTPDELAHGLDEWDEASNILSMSDLHIQDNENSKGPTAVLRPAIRASQSGTDHRSDQPPPDRAMVSTGEFVTRESTAFKADGFPVTVTDVQGLPFDLGQFDGVKTRSVELNPILDSHMSEIDKRPYEEVPLKSLDNPHGARYSVPVQGQFPVMHDVLDQGAAYVANYWADKSRADAYSQLPPEQRAIVDKQLADIKAQGEFIKQQMDGKPGKVSPHAPLWERRPLAWRTSVPPLHEGSNETLLQNRARLQKDSEHVLKQLEHIHAQAMATDGKQSAAAAAKPKAATLRTTVATGPKQPQPRGFHDVHVLSVGTRSASFLWAIRNLTPPDIKLAYCTSSDLPAIGIDAVHTDALEGLLSNWGDPCKLAKTLAREATSRPVHVEMLDISADRMLIAPFATTVCYGGTGNLPHPNRTANNDILLLAEKLVSALKPATVLARLPPVEEATTARPYAALLTFLKNNGYSVLKKHINQAKYGAHFEKNTYVIFATTTASNGQHPHVQWPSILPQYTPPVTLLLAPTEVPQTARLSHAEQEVKMWGTHRQRQQDPFRAVQVGACTGTKSTPLYHPQHPMPAPFEPFGISAESPVLIDDPATGPRALLLDEMLKILGINNDADGKVHQLGDDDKLKLIGAADSATVLQLLYVSMVMPAIECMQREQQFKASIFRFSSTTAHASDDNVSWGNESNDIMDQSLATTVASTVRLNQAMTIATSTTPIDNITRIYLDVPARVLEFRTGMQYDPKEHQVDHGWLYTELRLRADDTHHPQQREISAALTQAALVLQQQQAQIGAGDCDALPDAIYHFADCVVKIGVPCYLTKQDLPILTANASILSHHTDALPILFYGFDDNLLGDFLCISGSNDADIDGPPLGVFLRREMRNRGKKSDAKQVFDRLRFHTPIKVPDSVASCSPCLAMERRWIIRLQAGSNYVCSHHRSVADCIAGVHVAPDTKSDANCKMNTKGRPRILMSSRYQSRVLKQGTELLLEDSKHTPPPMPAAVTVGSGHRAPDCATINSMKTSTAEGQPTTSTGSTAMVEYDPRGITATTCAVRLRLNSPLTFLDKEHIRLGHRAHRAIAEYLLRTYPGRKFDWRYHPCSVCAEAKAKRLATSPWTSRPKDKLGFWSFDVCIVDKSDGTVTALDDTANSAVDGNAWYCYLGKEAASRVVAGRFEDTHDDATTKAVLDSIEEEAAAHGIPFTHVAADRGELATPQMRAHLTKKGWSSEYTTSGESSENGAAENTIWVIMCMVRAMIIGAGLLQDFRRAALAHSINITNHFPSRKLIAMRKSDPEILTIPMQEAKRLAEKAGGKMWTYQNELNRVKPFGCLAYLITGGNNMHGVSRPCIYLGRATDTKDGSYMLDPMTKARIVVRHAAFDEYGISLTLSKPNLIMATKIWKVRSDIVPAPEPAPYTTFVVTLSDGTKSTVELKPLDAFKQHLVHSSGGMESVIISEAAYDEPIPDSPHVTLEEFNSLQDIADPTPPSAKTTIHVSNTDTIEANFGAIDRLGDKSQYIADRIRAAHGKAVADAKKLSYVNNGGTRKRYTLTDIRYDVSKGRMTLQPATTDRGTLLTSNDARLCCVYAEQKVRVCSLFAAVASPATPTGSSKANDESYVYWTLPGKEPKSQGAIDKLPDPQRVLWDAAAFKEEATQLATGSYDLIPITALGPFKAPREVLVTKSKEQGRDKMGKRIFEKHRYRTTMNGAHSTDGIDYFAMDSQTLSLTTFKVFLAVCMLKSLLIESGDVEGAYLSAPIHYPMFSSPVTERFRMRDHNNIPYVKWHRRATYGGVICGALWQERLTQILLGIGFHKIPSTDAVFIFHQELRNSRRPDPVIIVGVFVDDFGMGWNNYELSIWFKVQLALHKLKVIWKGEMDWFLGASVLRNYINDTLNINLSSYIEEAAEEFACTKYKKMKFPTDVDISKDQCPTDQKVKDYMKTQPFRRILGKLNWCVQFCCPSVSFVLHKLQSMQQNPAPLHLKVAKELLAYVYQIRDVGLTFHGPQSAYWTDRHYEDSNSIMYDPEQRDQATFFFDSSHTQVETEGSWPQIGATAFLAGVAVWNQSRKVTLSGTSTAFSEACAGFEASLMVIAMRNVLNDLRVFQRTTTIAGDNQSMIDLTHMRVPTKATRTWHFMRINHLQELQLLHIANFVKVDTHSNPSDINTKLLTDPYKFKSFENQLCGQPSIYVPGTSILTRHWEQVRKEARKAHIQRTATSTDTAASAK